MEKNYEDFRALKLLGKRVETDKFDPKHLNFYKLIHEINLFVDNIPRPLNLSEKEKSYILSHRKESIFSDHDTNLFNIRFGIEIGEKIDKSVMTAIFIRDKYSMISVIEMLVENYSDRSFVLEMLPMKAIAAVIDSDECYGKLLDLYKMFGMKIVLTLIDYFDADYFLKKFIASTLGYLRYVDRHMDLMYEYTNDHVRFNNVLQEIFEEGKNLKCLCKDLITEYHLEAFEEDDLGFQANEVVKWIENALCDVEDMMEAFKK
jgi:hypothetical protein